MAISHEEGALLLAEVAAMMRGSLERLEKVSRDGCQDLAMIAELTLVTMGSYMRTIVLASPLSQAGPSIEEAYRRMGLSLDPIGDKAGDEEPEQVSRTND